MNLEQYDAGLEAAKAAKATTPKPYGQTSPDNYSFTYWYVKGWNDFVEGKA